MNDNDFYYQTFNEETEIGDSSELPIGFEVYALHTGDCTDARINLVFRTAQPVMHVAKGLKCAMSQPLCRLIYYLLIQMILI